MEITPEVREQVLREEVAAHRIVILSTVTPSAEEAISGGCKTLVETARGGPLTGVPAGTEQVCAGVQDIFKARVPQREAPATGFYAQRDGVTAAGRCLAVARQTAPKAAVVELDPTAVVSTCDEIDVLTATAEKLRAAAAFCEGLASPRIQYLYNIIRDADEVLTPLAKRDPALATKLKPMFDYSKGRFQRAVASRMQNAARDERTREEVKEEIGEEVRAEVRAEVIGAMSRDAQKVAAPAEAPTAKATPVLPLAATTRTAARTRRRPGRK